MSEIIGISATELERLSVLALSGTPALSAGQVYDVDGQRYRWTGTAWEKRWRSQWLPVRAETNEAGEVVRVATSTIDLPVVTYQTSPGGGIALSVGGVSAELPEIAAAQSAATLASATAALTPVLTDEREYIQGYYVKVGGTRTTGRSTPGDWSDANCYGDIQTALNQGWTSDDAIVIDDGEWVTPSLSLSTTAALTGADIVLRSRSMDRSRSRLTFTGINGFAVNNSTKLLGLRVRGITIGAGTITSASPVLLACTRPSRNVVFEDCDFADTVIDAPANNGTHGFFQCGTSGTRTVTFVRCRFYRMHATMLGNLWFATGIAGCKAVFDDCDFGVPGLGGLSAMAMSPTGGWLGGIAGPLDVKILNCRQYGVEIEVTAPGGAAHPFVSISGTLEIDGLYIEETHVKNGQAGAFGVRVAGPYDIKRLYASHCSSTPGWGQNTTGGALMIYGPGADGVAEEIVIRNCVSDFGTAVYWGQGGGGEVRAVVAYDCIARVDSLLYSGGWGDTSAVGIVGVNCALGVGGSGHPQPGTGGVLYAHLHTTMGTRDKLAEYRHVRLIGCENADVIEDGANTLLVYNANPTYLLTVAIEDLAAAGGDGNHIRVSGDGGAVSIAGDVAVPGGDASVTTQGTITGGLNVTGNVQGFPRVPTLEEAIAWARDAAGI